MPGEKQHRGMCTKARQLLLKNIFVTKGPGLIRFTMNSFLVSSNHAFGMSPYQQFGSKTTDHPFQYDETF